MSAKGNLLEIKWGRTLLKFKSKKKPLQGRTESAGHSDTDQVPHSVGQPHVVINLPIFVSLFNYSIYKCEMMKRKIITA